MAGGSSSATIIAGRNPIQYSASNPLPLFIVQLLIIVCLCRFLHLFLKRIYQPTVISEVIGGIILGPTVLSRWTAFQKNVFPTDSLAILTLVSNFGLVLFLFMVGLELDPKALKRNLHRCIAISAAGMLLPFGLGVAVSYAIYKILMDSKGSFVIFLLFTGVAMAITAFPVLARILTEQNLLKTTVGSIAISAASIDDVVSWCLLALVIALTNNATGLTALWVFLVGAGYVLFILFVVRPIYCWYLTRTGCLNGRDPSQTVLFITFMMVLVSAFFTDIIGIHPIFGGFIIGVIVPHSGGFAIKVTEKIEDVVQIFFLPIYFVLSGLKTNLSDLSDGKTWGLVILVCAVAFIGKIGGCTLAARFSKYTWRESLTIGFLMNCKGLVELIVLNIGLDAGVIDVRVFSLMVVMALVTTCATSPMVVWLYPLKYQKRIDGIYGDGAEITMENDADSAISRRHGPDAGHPMNMLVVLSKIQQVPAIMTLLSYLHHQPELTSSRMLTANENGTNAKPLILESLYRPIKVFGLRLLEYTGRDSSIMTQYQLESQVLLDPAMAMFRAFARVANMVFHSLLAYSERERFVDSILSSTKDTNSELTVVSAFGRGSQQITLANNSATGSNENSNNDDMLAMMRLLVPGWFESMGWGFTTDQQAALITALFDRAGNHVGIFIDCGLAEGIDHLSADNTSPAIDNSSNKSNNSKQGGQDRICSSHVVFDEAKGNRATLPTLAPLFFADGHRVPLVVVPFFGGPDDRQALKLATDLCTHSAVQVVVWRFVKAELPTVSDVVLSETNYPARPVMPETPSAIHQRASFIDYENGGEAGLAEIATYVDEKQSDDNMDERNEDELFIATELRPFAEGRARRGSIAHRRRDSSASAQNDQTRGNEAPPSSSPKALAAPQSHEATDATAMPPLKITDTRATLAEEFQQQLANASETDSRNQSSSGGLRSRITQRLRLRNHRLSAQELSGNVADDNGLSDDPKHNLVDTTLTAGIRATQYANLSIETVVTTTPLQTFLLRARTLRSTDLIICGRSVRVSFPYFNHKQELKAYTPAGHAHTKMERQRALGTVAEYTLGFGTNASLLVIQASKDNMLLSTDKKK